MDSRTKKVWPSVAASLVAFTGLVSADNGCPPQPCCPCPQVLNRVPPPCEINTSVNPVVNCGTGLYVTASVFYWDSMVDGLEYAIMQDGNINPDYITSTPDQYVYTNSTFKTPEWSWDFGFKLGLGYSFVRDGWDVYLNWTHFVNNFVHTQEADAGQRMYTLWSAAQDNAKTGNIQLANSLLLYAEDAKVKYQLSFNTLDLELGREFYTSHYLSLRPFVSLRLGKFALDYDIDYTGGAFSPPQTPGSGYVDEVRYDNDFWGVGPRLGLNSEWSFGCGWSLYGDLGISLLYGRFSVDQEEGMLDITAQPSGTGLITPEYQVLHMKDDYRSTKAMTDLGLGLRWETGFDNSNFYVTLQLGWEHHMLFNFNQLWRIQPNPDSLTTYDPYTLIPESGDLETQGWTLSARFDF